MDLKEYIIDVPNFPEEGVVFKDITPLLNDPLAFKYSIDQMAQYAKTQGANVIIAPEARGFIFGPAVSYASELGFIPIRKPGKLPRPTLKVTYNLEYGSNNLELHADAIKTGDKVLIVDDVLATGGTARAMCELVESQHAEIVGLVFLIDLAFLNGKERLKKYPIKTLIEY